MSVLIDYWYQIRLNPPVIQLSCSRTQESLRLADFHFEIPAPGVLLDGFTQQESWLSKEE